MILDALELINKISTVSRSELLPIYLVDDNNLLKDMVKEDKTFIFSYPPFTKIYILDLIDSVTIYNEYYTDILNRLGFNSHISEEERGRVLDLLLYSDEELKLLLELI